MLRKTCWCESQNTTVSNPVSVVQSTKGTPSVMRAVPLIAEEIVNNVVDPSLVGAQPSDLGTDAPMQPILLPTSYPKSIIGNTQRRFQPGWFNDREWLEYSCSRMQLTASLVLCFVALEVITAIKHRMTLHGPTKHIGTGKKELMHMEILQHIAWP